MAGLILIIVVALFIITVMSNLFSGMVKGAIACILALLLFGFGFLWLPPRLEAMSNGDITFSELIEDVFSFNTLQETINETEKYWNENKDNIIDSANNIKDNVKTELEKQTDKN